jgi:hypothetical protein
LKCIPSLKNILSEYPGNIPVYLHLAEKGDITEVFSLKYRVKISEELLDRIQKCLGDESIVFVRK